MAIIAIFNAINMKKSIKTFTNQILLIFLTYYSYSPFSNLMQQDIAIRCNIVPKINENSKHFP